MQIVTYSEMNDFKTCRRKWELSYNKMLTTKQEPDYFKDGRCMHKALEAYYRATDPVVWTKQEAALFVLEKAIDKAYDNSWLEDEKERHHDLLKAMLENYFEFATENDNFTPLFLEKEFQVLVQKGSGRRPRLMLAGRVDGLVKNDGVWLLEFKTAKDISPAYLNFLNKDSQITCYVYAMSKEYPEIEGALYTILRKRKKSKEPLVKRKKVLRTSVQLLDFKREIITVAEEMREGVIYRSPSQWNCNYCPYQSICDWEDAEIVDYEYRVKERKHEELNYG